MTATALSIALPAVETARRARLTHSALTLSATLVGLCCTAPLHAQAQEHYRVLGWQPATSVIERHGVKGTIERLTLAQPTAPSSEKLCLHKDTASQTLVQMQPAEGGEARFVILGGQQPGCRLVGEGWKSAPSGEAPWYKTLFAMLGSQTGGTRVSASTAGVTRGGATNDPSQPGHRDDCGLYPSAQGLIQWSSGTSDLTLGTHLPDGTTITLHPKATEAPHPLTAIVRQGKVQWPKTSLQAGELWTLSYTLQPASGAMPSTSKNCGARIAVQARNNTPYKAVQDAGPRFAADPATVQATLVAAQLEDASLAAWHAWLLSTIAPTSPAAQDLGALLWRQWWSQNNGTSGSSTPVKN